MRTINYTYILFLVMTLLVACDSPRERRDLFYSKAMNYYQQDQFDDAQVELKNVLRIDPRYVPGYVLLGDIALKKNAVKKAYKNYTKGYDLDSGSQGANLGLATCYLRSEEYERARPHIQTVLDASPDDPMAHYIHALLSHKTGAFHASLKESLAIQDLDKSRNIFLLIANNHLALQNYDLAIQTLQKGISTLGDDIPLHLALARVYELDTRLSAAEEEYLYLTKLDSGDENYQYLLVNFYMKNKKNDQAKNILQKRIDTKKDDKAIRLLAEILMDEGKFEDVREMLVRQLTDVPSNFELKRFLVEFYISQKDFTPAIRALRELLKDDQRITQQNLYKKILASVYRSQNKMVDVRELMKQVLVSNPNDKDALMFSASESVRNGLMNNAILQFRQVIHLESNQDRGYLGLANAYLLTGDSSMAIQVLFDCIEQNGSNRARFTLARIFERENRYDRAIEQFEMLSKQNAKDGRIIKHLAWLYLKEGHVGKAEESLKKCLLLDSDPISSRLALADFYRLRGQFNAAHGEVDHVLEQKGSHIQAYVEKIKILHAENKDEEGFDFIRTHIETSTLRNYLRGELYALQNNYTKAERYYRKSLNGDQRGQVYYKLANMYLEQKKYSQGIDVCKKIVLEYPDDAKSHFLSGYFYQLDMQYDSAIVEYKIALEKSPAFFPAVNNLAFLYAEKFPSKSNLDEALGMMLNHDFAMTIDGLDTLAWIYTQRGEYQKSISLLEKLSARSDSTPVIFYHLGVTYLKKGDLLPAKSWIEKSLATGNDFTEKSEALALLKSFEG